MYLRMIYRNLYAHFLLLVQKKMGKKKTTAKSKCVISRRSHFYGFNKIIVQDYDQRSDKNYLALSRFTSVDFAGVRRRSKKGNVIAMSEEAIRR